MLVAVVDDNPQDAGNIAGYIGKFSADTGTSLRVATYSDAVAFLRDDTTQFSIVVFDVQMPGINGVEAARLLRERDPGVVIMFVTNMPQYALFGYEVEAVDYVLKPISYADFSLKLKKALRYVGRNREHSIMLSCAEGPVSVSVWEILYVESAKHYLTYHTSSGQYRTRGTMTATEGELAPHHFARCNSGYLVNLRHVHGISGDEVVVGDERLKVSRGRRAGFMEAFARYVGGIDG